MPAKNNTNPAKTPIFSRCLSKLEGKKTALFGNFEEADEFAESLMRVGKAAKCVMLSAARTEEEAEDLGKSLIHKKEIRPDLAGTVPIIFSTITGNAYKLAVAAAEAVPDHVGPYNIRYITDEVIDKFDTFVLSYWCNHGTADDDTIDLIAGTHGKKLIVIGSLGVSTDTAHAAKVCENVIALASEHNILLGHYGVGWESFRMILPYAAVGIFICAFLPSRMNILMLGDETANSLGLRTELFRFFLIAVSSLLAGAAISVAGLISFVGLVIPHIARLLVGSDYKYLFPASALLGFSLVCICDTVGRVILPPGEVPVSIILSFIGAPFFLYLLRTREGKRG